MRAVAVVPSEQQIRLTDREPPRRVSSTDVELRILEVGVCGTDREIAQFEYGTPPAGERELVIGHESLAEVTAVGTAVEGLLPGDLVVPSVRRPCPHPQCAPCRAGRQDFCTTGDFTERGIKGVHGYMTEVVVDDRRWMTPVPAALRDVAVLVEPLTIAEKALIQVEQVQQRLPWPWAGEPGQPRYAGRRAVVLGAGPVGILGAMVLLHAGFATIVYSRARPPDPKIDLVTAIGARYVSSQDLDERQLVEEVGNIDVIYEATGVADAAFALLPALGVNGVYVLTGVPAPGRATAIDTSALMRELVLKNQVVLGTVNAGRDAFAAAVRDLGAFDDRWPKALRGLITARHPLEAFRDVIVEKPAGIKHVLQVAGT